MIKFRNLMRKKLGGLAKAIVAGATSQDVPIEDIRKKVYWMVKKGILQHTPGKTYRRYWLAKKNRNEKESY